MCGRALCGHVLCCGQAKLCCGHAVLCCMAKLCAVRPCAVLWPSSVVCNRMLCAAFCAVLCGSRANPLAHVAPPRMLWLPHASACSLWLPTHLLTPPLPSACSLWLPHASACSPTPEAPPRMWYSCTSLTRARTHRHKTRSPNHLHDPCSSLPPIVPPAHSSGSSLFLPPTQLDLLIPLLKTHRHTGASSPYTCDLESIKPLHTWLVVACIVTLVQTPLWYGCFTVRVFYKGHDKGY